jgi:phosphoenolpyruvate-protein phosphotransferase (PTS system enzyme I)
MQGLATSPGIGIGKAFLYREPVIELNKHDIKSTKQEVARFDKAIERAKSEIDKLYKKNLKRSLKK